MRNGCQQHQQHDSDNGEQQRHGEGTALTVGGTVVEQSTMAEGTIGHENQHKTHQDRRGQLVTEMAKEPAHSLARKQRADATVREGCTQQPRHQHEQQLCYKQRKGNMWQKLLQRLLAIG
jgi:hypothetical protein